MRHVEYRRLLNEHNAVRVSFDLEHGKVLGFAVQLECQLIEPGAWTPVIRYDTAHGFAHCDRLHPYDETTKTLMPVQGYNETLTFAIDDIEEHCEEYRRRYLSWLKKN